MFHEHAFRDALQRKALEAITAADRHMFGSYLRVGLFPTDLPTPLK